MGLRAALALYLGSVVAWTPRTSTSRRRSVVVHGGRKATPLGRVSTREGKSARVAEYRDQVAGATVMWSVDGSKFDVKTLSSLRNTLPEDGSKAVMLKNTLLKVAGRELGWEESTLDAAEPLLMNSNLWVLAGDNPKETMKSYKAWLKEFGLDKADDKKIKFGFSDGALLDPKGVEAVVDLPTKPELMARLAGAIQQAGPLGLASSIQNAKGNPKGLAVRLKQAAGTKLATALKISVADEGKNTN